MKVILSSLMILSLLVSDMPAAARPRSGVYDRTAHHPVRGVPSIRKHRAGKHRRHLDANGNMVTVITANGLTAKVAASVRERFQNFIDEVEGWGNRISEIACYVRRGHMPGSKHYKGLACDIAQVKRNVTKDKFMLGVADVAAKHGLTDGCTWQVKKGERYTGPDCGHIEADPIRTAGR